jgi:hypothetical protein
MCLNLHECVHTILDELEKTALVGTETTPNGVIRGVTEDWRLTFPSIVRGVAYKGWQTYGNEFLTGRWTRSFHLWTTDGTPKRIEVPRYSDVMSLRRTRERLLSSVRLHR